MQGCLLAQHACDKYSQAQECKAEQLFLLHGNEWSQWAAVTMWPCTAAAYVPCDRIPIVAPEQAAPQHHVLCYWLAHRSTSNQHQYTRGPPPHPPQ